MINPILETEKLLSDLLKKLDDELSKIDNLLNILQPVRTGKIRIVWWTDRRGNIRPVIVRWIKIKSKNGKWRSEYLSPKGLPKRAKTRLSFKQNSAVVKELLRWTTELFEIRAKAVDATKSFVVRTKNLTRENSAKLSGMGKGLDKMLQVVFEKQRLEEVEQYECAEEQDELLPDE